MKGLLSPLRRDKKRDFASGSGADLLKSKVIQVLMTEGSTPSSSGELLWRTDFGSPLLLLRHQRNDDVLAELARVYVKEALDRWVPEVTLVDVVATRDGEILTLSVTFRSNDTDGQNIVEIAEISLAY